MSSGFISLTTILVPRRGDEFDWNHGIGDRTSLWTIINLVLFIKEPLSNLISL